MLQSVSGERKIVSSYVNNRQPLTVYHVKVVTKCSPKTTH